MKKFILTAIIALANTIAFSQSQIPEAEKKAFNEEQKAANWNFKIEDDKIYWQKIFKHPECDTLLVKEHFNNNPIFKKEGPGYTANLILSEYTKEPNMNIPFILHSTANLIFYVQFKQDRYRVTIEKCSWTGEAGTVGTITIMQQVGLSMQDLKNKAGKLKTTACKHTNICFLNLLNYNSNFNKKGNILQEDF